MAEVAGFCAAYVSRLTDKPRHSGGASVCRKTSIYVCRGRRPLLGGLYARHPAKPGRSCSCRPRTACIWRSPFSLTLKCGPTSQNLLRPVARCQTGNIVVKQSFAVEACLDPTNAGRVSHHDWTFLTVSPPYKRTAARRRRFTAHSGAEDIRAEPVRRRSRH